MGNLGVPWNQGFISETINNANKFPPINLAFSPLAIQNFRGTMILQGKNIYILSVGQCSFENQQLWLNGGAP